jgi:hypothetical protein
MEVLLKFVIIQISEIYSALQSIITAQRPLEQIFIFWKFLEHLSEAHGNLLEIVSFGMTSNKTVQLLSRLKCF